MTDFDENATPLNKLGAMGTPPMPVVQSKADMPPVDPGPASYQEIMNKVQAEPGPGIAQGMQHLMPSLPSFQQYPQYAQPAGGPDPGHGHGHGHRGGGGGRRRRAAPPPRKKKKSLLSSALDAVRDYKSSLLVGLVVFLVLSYAAPKLALVAPRLLTPAGRFGALGLLIIALACGGIHRVLDRFVSF